MLSPDDLRVSKFRARENRDGFAIQLECKMTEEKSKETEWKQIFAERYHAPDFKGLEQTEDPLGFDIKRTFEMGWLADVGATVETVSDVIDMKLDAMDAEQELNDDVSSEPSSDSPAVSQ